MQSVQNPVQLLEAHAPMRQDFLSYLLLWTRCSANFWCRQTKG
jgi:hypothetical protein